MSLARSFSLDALQPVYLMAHIRQIEHRAFAMQPPPPLMQRAGEAAAHLAREMLSHGKRVLVVAGPGNNGGDAWVCAQQLREWWFDVQVLFAGDADRLPKDAADAMQRWMSHGGTWHTVWNAREMQADLIVDGLLGIGVTRLITGPLADLIEHINQHGAPVLSLDVPSGLDADSGKVMGHAVRATRTITFLGLKPGLLTLDGPDYAGHLTTDLLQLDSASFHKASGRLLDARVLHVLSPRTRNSHKGSYGSVGVIGGGAGMVGAAILAGRAALHLGAGRVYVGLIAEDAPAVDWMHPELMLRPAEEAVSLEQATCLVTGPGAGQTPRAGRLLDAAIARPLPLILDADALNLMAIDPLRASALRHRKAPTLITPHPAEAARLLAKSNADVQSHRVSTAIELAQKFNACAVLKGAGSVCAFPDGRWFINTTGNPGLAAAGMGDVLAGIIAALIAQGAEPSFALLAGVHLHGLAADQVLAKQQGPIGMTAQDIVLTAREVLNAHLYGATTVP